MRLRTLALLLVGLTVVVALAAILMREPAPDRGDDPIDDSLRSRETSFAGEGEPESEPIEPPPLDAPPEIVPPAPIIIAPEPATPAEASMPPPTRPGRPTAPSEVRLARLAWEDTAGIETLEYVAEAIGHRLVMSEASRAVAERMRVTLKIENTTAEGALDLLTNSYALWWTVRDGVLYVEQGDDD